MRHVSLNIAGPREGCPYIKVKVVFTAVSSPLDRSNCFTLFALPGRRFHSDTHSASPGSILARQQLRPTTKSLTCPPLSMARYILPQATCGRRDALYYGATHTTINPAKIVKCVYNARSEEFELRFLYHDVERDFDRIDWHTSVPFTDKLS